MEQEIRDEIIRFARESETARFPVGDEPYFDAPLTGFASAVDPLFREYKTIIGDFHLTPHELVSLSTPDDTWESATVICWVLPISEKTRDSNRRETLYPSREWAHTRSFGELCNVALRRHMTEWLTARGYRAAAPQLSAAWRELPETPSGIASTWSERHAAYAAGLGTFSLNDGLITPKGIAHRLGSVITDLEIKPSARPYTDHRANCLKYSRGVCGACIARCPAGAMSPDGHDKHKCREYVYGALPEAVGEVYGVKATGCGLCQTKVPCESRIPAV